MTDSLIPDHKGLHRTSPAAPAAVPGPHAKNWIAVASAAHARQGCALPQRGFMQVCHGKCGPLQRLRPGDRVVYYSPTVTMGGKDKLQAFVSLGVVLPGAPYAVDMGAGFVPYRRDVAYVPTQDAPIVPLLDALDFVQDRARWGYMFRFGLFEIGQADMARIAQAMRADLHALGLEPPAATPAGAQVQGPAPTDTVRDADKALAADRQALLF